jgi:hypothetical protein
VPQGPRTAAKKSSPVTDAERARAIVASLRAGEPGSDEVYDAFWELDALPADDVREALTPWVGPLADMAGLDNATRTARGLPLHPLRLRTLSVEKDADILDVGPVAEEQLRLAGKSWDGVDLPPEERLDGELEGSLAGTLERRVLADADAEGATPLFDVLLFGEDSGVVFAAGTANVVAMIAYHKVEMRNRRTRVAIEEALSARGMAPMEAAPVEAAPVEAVPVEAVPVEAALEEAAPASEIVAVATPAKKAAKKTATKTAKKTATKTAKKTATKIAKKTATKTAKKTAATKTAVTSAKKTAATSAPKTPAKKAKKTTAARKR